MGFRSDAVRAVALALTLVAFALRLFHLDAQSLWYDEAFSVVLAWNPLPQLLNRLATTDNHPPLHPLLLAGWMPLAGDTEFAVRLPSALAGTLLVPVVHVLARRLAGWEVALEQWEAGAHRGLRRAAPGAVAAVLAALLTTASPYLVYYSQEARGYQLAALFGALSIYALLRALPKGGVWWGAYAALTFGALATHYATVSLLAVQALFVVVMRLWFGAPMRRWFQSLSFVAAAYLPWVVFTGGRLGRPDEFWPGPVRPVELALIALGDFLGGSGAAQAVGLSLGVLCAALLGLVVVPMVGRGQEARATSVLLLAYAALPVVVVVLAAVVAPKFHPRYAIFALPALLVVWSRGIDALWRLGSSTTGLPGRIALRMGSGGVLALLVVLSLWGLHRLYGDPSLRRDDWRSAVAYMVQHAGPRDAVGVVMNAHEPVVYYYRGELPVRGLQFYDDFEGAVRALNELTSDRDGLWLFLWNEDWADPAGFVRHTLTTQWREEPVPQVFHGVRLRRFTRDGPGPFALLPPLQHQTDVNLGGIVRVLGWSGPSAPVSQGGQFEVDLHWETLQRPEGELKLLFTLEDAAGREWLRADRYPVTYFYRTPQWRLGVPLHGHHVLPVPVGTPPGAYALKVSVYSSSQVRELDIIGDDGRPKGTRLTLGTVHVAPAPSPLPRESLAIDHRWPSPPVVLEEGEPAARLLGYTIRQERASTGDVVSVLVGWEALGPTRRPLEAVVRGYQEGALTLEDRFPISGSYASTDWRRGDLLLGRYEVVVPPDVATGDLTLAIGVAASGGDVWLPLTWPLYASPEPVVTLGTLRIEARPMRTDVPPMAHRLEVDFAGKAQLLGFDLSTTEVAPGEAVDVTLYWRASSRMDVSYKVFTHVVDQHDNFVGQRDREPGDGSLKTTGWRPGEVLVDRYTVAVAPDAAPGTYLLKVGLYDPRTMERLAVRNADGPSGPDYAVLGTIRVRGMTQ